MLIFKATVIFFVAVSLFNGFWDYRGRSLKDDIRGESGSVGDTQVYRSL